MLTSSSLYDFYLEFWKASPSLLFKSDLNCTELLTVFLSVPTLKEEREKSDGRRNQSSNW